MDWLKVEKATPHKPEIFQIAARLGMTIDEAFGKCFRLWSWADSHTSTGIIHGITVAIVDAIVGLSGFGDALAAAGWLNVGEGRLVIPNFGRHMGKSAKRRAESADRMRSRRQQPAAPNVDDLPSPPPISFPPAASPAAARLAQKFVFRQTRRPRDPEYNVAAMLDEVMRRVTEADIMREIDRDSRHRNESIKEFCNRIDAPEFTKKRPSGVAEFRELAKECLRGNTG
jgi:hypothetical protein